MSIDNTGARAGAVRTFTLGFAVTLVAALSASSAIADGGVYQEQDGLLVIEFESANPGGDWSFEQTVTEYTGTGYQRWNGPNLFSSPGHGTFGFDFHIHNPATYDFRIRNYHDHPDSTEENDVWVSLDGGPWIKVFSGVNNQWTWATNHELSETNKPLASYELSAGQHRIEFSGRSYNFRMDRFHMFIPGTPGGQNTNRPESECVFPERRPVADVQVSPAEIPEFDHGATVVTLDASGSFDPEGTQLSYRWHARGATFVNGTDRTSPVAQVTFEGGHVYPLRLTVLDEAGLGDRAHAALGVEEQVGHVGGAPVVWQPLDIAFHGPHTNENAVDPNPFLDYRLLVTFTGPSGQVYVVHGFYDGDGNGAGTGDVWRVRFTPDEAGMWSYAASFRMGDRAGIKTTSGFGEATAFDGAHGLIAVLGTDDMAEGFLAKGRLSYVGEHYLRFANGEWFLKGGTDSPENFLGYDGFDDVVDSGNVGIIHRYSAHVSDWRPGDPYFTSSSSGVDSKGIIGALNYLSREHVNSIYFLPMNLGGDGQETYPFVSPDNSDEAKLHYDVSRLAQWTQVLDHAQRQGILLHFVLAETESGNENWLDGGGLGVQRKLFYKELVARFGHALALKWNLCEENDFSIQSLNDFATFIQWVDPYDSPIAVHTHLNDFNDYAQLVGNPLFSATSIQYDPNMADDYVKEWRERSADMGHRWVIDMDENAPALGGLNDQNADDLRKRVLYDVYFSGGQVEWYAGYHELPLGGDLNLENFATRQAMWRYMWHARKFMQDNLPFWEMQGCDDLVVGEGGGFGGAQVFCKPGEVYAIYLPVAGAGSQDSGNIQLDDAPGEFRGRWFDPRSGQFAGQFDLTGGDTVDLPLPPNAVGEDWVLLLEKKAAEHQPQAR
jgi:hypothetical protein